MSTFTPDTLTHFDIEHDYCDTYVVNVPTQHISEVINTTLFYAWLVEHCDDGYDTDEQAYNEFICDVRINLTCYDGPHECLTKTVS